MFLFSVFLLCVLFSFCVFFCFFVQSVHAASFLVFNVSLWFSNEFFFVVVEILFFSALLLAR